MKTLRVMFFVVALSAASAPTYAGTVEIMHGSVAIDADSYKWYSFEVPKIVAHAIQDARVEGHLEASGGSGNDIEVYVLSETQFTNWKNNHETPTLYNSGRSTALDVYAPIAKPGRYHVVFYNGFSAFTPKTVEGELNLLWTDPASGEDTSPGTPDDEAFTAADGAVLGGLVLAIGGTGVLIGRRLNSRRKTS